MHPDVERAVSVLDFLCPDTDLIVAGIIPGNPPTKARPRFSKHGHAYTSAEAREAEKVTAWELKTYFKEPLKGNLAVACVFCRRTKGRVDVDNLMKHLLDSANKVAWYDDYQITALCGMLDLDRENPRTIFAVGQHLNSTMDRSDPTTVGSEGTCTRCGERFTLDTSQRRVCLNCRSATQGQLVCPSCGGPKSRNAIACRQCAASSRRGVSRSKRV